MPDTHRRYFFYHNAQTDFFELGYLAEGLPGVVLYRSSALGSGTGRALLVWPLRAETPPPRLAIPASLIAQPPFRFCSAAEALAAFEASFRDLRWLGFEDPFAQRCWNVPDLVAQFQRQVAADAQARARHARQAA
ncbi:MAG TPA: hypothetical protein VFZ66_27895 [Herpetosiphonaceae bacterium]